MKKVYNQRGTVILQVMLASAVLVIIATGTMTISSMLNSQDKAIIHKQNLDGFSSLVNSMINDEVLCFANFATTTPVGPNQRGLLPVNPFAPATAATASGIQLELRLPQYPTQRFTAGAPISSREAIDIGLQIESVRFANAVLLSTTVTDNIYEGDLEITASAMGGILIPTMRKNLGKVKLNFDIVTNTYNGCGAGVTPGDICTSLGGIYQSALTPACRFGIKDVAPCPAGEIIVDVTTEASGDVTRTCVSADMRCGVSTLTGNQTFLLAINRNGPVNATTPSLTCGDLSPAPPPPPPPPPPLPVCYKQNVGFVLAAGPPPSCDETLSYFATAAECSPIGTGCFGPPYMSACTPVYAADTDVSNCPTVPPTTTWGAAPEIIYEWDGMAGSCPNQLLFGLGLTPPTFPPLCSSLAGFVAGGTCDSAVTPYCMTSYTESPLATNCRLYGHWCL